MPDTTAQKLKFSKIIPKIVAEESNVKLGTENTADGQLRYCQGNRFDSQPGRKSIGGTVKAIDGDDFSRPQNRRNACALFGRKRNIGIARKVAGFIVQNPRRKSGYAQIKMKSAIYGSFMDMPGIERRSKDISERLQITRGIGPCITTDDCVCFLGRNIEKNPATQGT